MSCRRTMACVALTAFFYLPNPARAQEGQGASACKATFVLEQADASVVGLLSKPIVPPPTMLFAAQSTRKIKQWDFPDKVTAWRARPAAGDLERQWLELDASWYGIKAGDTSKTVPPPTYAPYTLLQVAPDEWKKIAAWMEKEASKQAPGLCPDEQHANYFFIAAGVRDPTAPGSTVNPARTLQYTQLAGTPQAEGIGPGGHSAASTGHVTVTDEFNAGGESDDPSVYACVFLFRTQETAAGGGRARRAAPELYYCRSAGGLRSSLSAMLKYVAKQGLP